MLGTIYQCQPFFFFHTINTYENSDRNNDNVTNRENMMTKAGCEIVIDLITYKDSEVCHTMIESLQIYGGLRERYVKLNSTSDIIDVSFKTLPCHSFGRHCL